jgi:geranyl-CoA carboxylase alpha subunit
VRYVGAGTIEFLLSPDGHFYFLEMNTRLQVEHPVTEAVTGLDLVEWQLRVAQGEPLPLRQQDIQLRGHAIEARLCAEDSFGGYVPQSGRIVAWQPSQIEGIRIDHGLAGNAWISPYYDSMVAKVISYGATRDAARQQLVAALKDTTVFGIVNNREHLLRCLQADEFSQAKLSTRWLTDASVDWQAPAADGAWLAVAAALCVEHGGRAHGSLANFSSNGPRVTPMAIGLGDDVHRLLVTPMGAARFRTESADGQHDIVLHPAQPATLRRAVTATLRRAVTLDGRRLTLCGLIDRENGWLDFAGVSLAFQDLATRPPQRNDADAGGNVTCRMHGLVVKLEASVGQTVKRGQLLLAIEAMKMEHRIEAPIDGVVAELGATQGQQVSPGRLLARIEPSA